MVPDPRFRGCGFSNFHPQPWFCWSSPDLTIIWGEPHLPYRQKQEEIGFRSSEPGVAASEYLVESPFLLQFSSNHGVP